MRCEDRWAAMLGGIAAHREVILVDWVEARVPVPGFVEVNAIAGFLKRGLRSSCVVAEAVIRTVGEDRVDWLLVREIPRQRAGLRLCADRLWIHLRRRNRADNAIAV